MKTLTMQECTPGLRVVFVDHGLNISHPGMDGSHVHSPADDLPLAGRAGVIVGHGNSPGKPVAVVLAEPLDIAEPRRMRGHTCDGLAPDLHGVWARPEQLYTEDSHAAHKAAHKVAHKALAERDAAIAKAKDIAAEYLKK